VGDGRVLHFPIGTRRFAVPVTGILEIREVAEPTPVPGSPSVVAGLVEIRGRIVTLIDLARIFGAEERAGVGLLAVQFAEPLAHLGLLVADSAHNVETDPAAGEEEFDETAPAPGADPAGTEPAFGGAEPAERVLMEEESHGARDAEPSRPPPPRPTPEAGETPPGRARDADEEELSLGREIVLSGARPALLLDPAALAEYCARRVRARFRVSA